MFTDNLLSTASGGSPLGSSDLIRSVDIGRSSALSEELESVARRVRRRLKRMSGDIIEIGRELRAVKQRLERGGFLDWVETACGLSPRTAQLMMRTAEWAEGRREIVAHLEPTAIYLLAAPSTPETVRQDVLSRLQEGQTPATQVVRGMVRAAKKKKPTMRQNIGLPLRYEQSERDQWGLTAAETIEGQHIEREEPPEGGQSRIRREQQVTEAGIVSPQQEGSPQSTRPHEVILEGGCRTYPEIDPLRDTDPPWINGALRLIPILVEMIPLDKVPNRKAIIRGSLQMIPPLVEAVLELDEIP
jgi:hypothetical protein